MINIGFSVDMPGLARPDAVEILEGMLSAGCRAIQLHIHTDILAGWPQHLEVVKRFEYRTIHLPYLKDSSNDPALNDALLKLAGEIGGQNFSFHPAAGNLSWLADVFGGQICAENMDWQKNFGQTPVDLENVFAQLPGAGWTFDVNHVFSNDPSLELAAELYSEFAPRLRQYHLSGFVGKEMPHTLLADTKQDEIIKLVQDFSKPIILESLGPQNLERFGEELNYITTRL